MNDTPEPEPGTRDDLWTADEHEDGDDDARWWDE